MSDSFSRNSSALLSLLIVSTINPAYELSSDYKSFLPLACLDPPLDCNNFWPLNDNPGFPLDMFNSLLANSSLLSVV